MTIQATLNHQLALFQTPARKGSVTGMPVPQDKAVLYKNLIEPDMAYHSYWRYSRETRKGWIYLIVRFIGYGSFNGLSLAYCQLPNGEINEFGSFSLFPAKEQEILYAWGEEALEGYRELIGSRKKKERDGLIIATRKTKKVTA